MVPADSGKYDFLASSHALEHIANPIAALKEWHRLVRPDGYLVLLVPHFEGTFDHYREVTPLEHLQADFEADIREDDSTHYAEFKEKIDLARCPGLSRQQLEEQVNNAAHNRGIHHHVFDTDSLLQLLPAAGWCTVAVQARRPWDIFILAQRVVPGDTMFNQEKYTSPFKSDAVSR